MARRPRLFAPGLLYHVIARGNQRQPIFLTPADYETYLARLATYRERYAIQCFAYCLMRNHLHCGEGCQTCPSCVTAAHGRLCRVSPTSMLWDSSPT
jgi:REP element-mobilizing transposase RayT